MLYVVDKNTGTVLRFGSGGQIVREGERLVEAPDDLDPQAIRFVGDEPQPLAERRDT